MAASKIAMRSARWRPSPAALTGVAIAAIALAGCAPRDDSKDHQAALTPPPSQTTGSAPGPNADGVQGPPPGQAENGAATVNDKVVKH